jgi:hypothetical protein
LLTAAFGWLAARWGCVMSGSSKGQRTLDFIIQDEGLRATTAQRAKILAAALLSARPAWRLE